MFIRKNEFSEINIQDLAGTGSVSAADRGDGLLMPVDTTVAGY